MGELKAADILRVDVTLCGREAFGNNDNFPCPANSTCEGTLPSLELDCQSSLATFTDGVATVWCGTRNVYRDAAGNVTSDVGSRRASATFFVYLAD